MTTQLMTRYYGCRLRRSIPLRRQSRGDGARALQAWIEWRQREILKSRWSCERGSSTALSRGERRPAGQRKSQHEAAAVAEREGAVSERMRLFQKSEGENTYHATGACSHAHMDRRSTRREAKRLRGLHTSSIRSGTGAFSGRGSGGGRNI